MASTSGTDDALGSAYFAVLGPTDQLARDNTLSLFVVIRYAMLNMLRSSVR